ncbi:MAG: hypothetical protein GY749_41045 [Desulfobacteraceae bacterium]|nr:hypothetical protein [Desulfobacteraceae bacterium]
MTDNEKAEILKWIQNWKEAGAVMEQIRRDEMEHIDIQQIIENLDDAFESALINSPPRLTSGLVEQQAWFDKARR